MKKILLIEDEAAVRDSIKELLVSNGYLALTASDGMEGLELARHLKPDLIICDIMMPKLNGYEVIAEIRKDPVLSVIPFIFLTAKVEMTDLREGMELGADDYLTKPFRAVNLLKAIETRLEKFELLHQKQNSEIKKEDADKKARLTENDRLFLNVKDKPQLIRVGDIIFITAKSEYSTVCLINGNRLLTRKLIKNWEEQLPDQIFMRIHRSTIINANFINKIERWYKRSYMVYLKNTEEKFIISQRYASKIKSNFLI